MCHKLLVTFGCGHIGYTYSYCSNLQPSPSANAEHCRLFNQDRKSLPTLCGIGGKFCLHTVDGQRHTYISRAIAITRAVDNHCEETLRRLEKTLANISILRRATCTPNPLGLSVARHAQANFYQVYNNKLQAEWLLRHLNDRYDIGQDFFENVLPTLPYGTDLCLTYPAMGPPPDEAMPPPIGSGSYIIQRPVSSSAALSMRRKSAATRAGTAGVSESRTFTSNVTTKIANLNIDPTTGDRTGAIFDKVSRALNKLHRDTNYFPSTPVRARRVMSRQTNDTTTQHGAAETNLPMIRRGRAAPLIRSSAAMSQVLDTPTPPSQRFRQGRRTAQNTANKIEEVDESTDATVETQQPATRPSLMVRLPISLPPSADASTRVDWTQTQPMSYTQGHSVAMNTMPAYIPMGQSFSGTIGQYPNAMSTVTEYAPGYVPFGQSFSSVTGQYPGLGTMPTYTFSYPSVAGAPTVPAMRDNTVFTPQPTTLNNKRDLDIEENYYDLNAKRPRITPPGCQM